MLVARDMRPSGPELVAAFTEGVLALGVDVIDIGLASSDLLYYASGSRRLPAAMFTASHNPPEYNGIKLCHAGAFPVDLGAIKPLTEDVLAGRGPAPALRAGRRTEENLLADFVEHVVSFIDVDALRPRRVVADTANGMGGLVVPAVFDRLGMFELEVMYPRARRHLPEPPGGPAAAGEPTRPAGAGGVRWVRHRPGVRWRCRPRVRRRRDRHRPVRVDDDGDPVRR